MAWLVGSTKQDLAWIMRILFIWFWVLHSPRGGCLRGGEQCPFCYAEAVKNALKQFSQVYWKISGGDQLAGLLERWIRLILLLPLLLLETGRTGGRGNGPFHKPVLTSFTWASHLWSRDIYSLVSAIPKQKKCYWAVVWAGRWQLPGKLTETIWNGPAMPPGPSAGWSPLSAHMDTRWAKLLARPGPLFFMVPSKPPGLLLGKSSTA